MISFCCAVISKNLEDYLSIIADTLCKNTKLVKEVVFVQTDLRRDRLLRSWSKNGIDFFLYGMKPLDPPCPEPLKWEQMICGHACGLHQAIKRSKQPYVWMSDPDIFFFTSVDQIYVNLMEKYQLNLIGISHFNSEGQSYKDAPCVINCMMKRDNLPPADWLGGFHAQSGMRLTENPKPVMSVKDCWLIPGPLDEYYDQFPNPGGIFDSGCNLWLWNEQNKGKWLSFFLEKKQISKTQSYHSSDYVKNNSGFKELVYPLNYNLRNYTTNFGLTDSLGDSDLLYHRTRGCQEKADSYKNLYKALLPSMSVKLI